MPTAYENQRGRFKTNQIISQTRWVTISNNDKLRCKLNRESHKTTSLGLNIFCGLERSRTCVVVQYLLIAYERDPRLFFIHWIPSPRNEWSWYVCLFTTLLDFTLWLKRRKLTKICFPKEDDVSPWWQCVREKWDGDSLIMMMKMIFLMPLFGPLSKKIISNDENFLQRAFHATVLKRLTEKDSGKNEYGLILTKHMKKL